MTDYVAMFPPILADLRYLKGSRYRLVIAVVCDWEADLAGWIGKMEVRSNRGPTGELLATLDAYLSVTGSPANQVTLDIDANAAEIDGTWSAGVYDIEITPGASDPTRTLRVLQGRFQVDMEVTR